MARPKYRDPAIDDGLWLDGTPGAVNYGALLEQMPAGIDGRQAMQAIDDLGENAFMLDEHGIQELCGKNALNAGRQLVAAGHVAERAFDGDEVSGIVTELNRPYHPTFAFDLTEFGCDCDERSRLCCSHIAALMWAWRLDYRSFFKPKLLPEEFEHLARSAFGDFLVRATGADKYSDAMGVFRSTASRTGAAQASQAIEPAGHQPQTSSGASAWPVATPVAASQIALRETIEAEFNTAQLRDLAKWLGLKLKGTAKSGYIEQVTAEMQARVARMRQAPEVLLEGLAGEHALFVQRALTARDYRLPLPRNLANALWLQQVNKDPEKRLADLLEALRRHALLFPTRSYYGYRDVYYQWLPLAAGGGNLPLATWPPQAVLAKDSPAGATSAPPVNFLDAFELFIDALLSTGTEVRPYLPRHPKAAATAWLMEWEHQVDEAEKLLNSRPGWVPNPQSGISVPLVSPLTTEARARLENQTGLSGAQCEFMFGLAAALQLIEAPDTPAVNTRHKGAPNPPVATWRVNVRASAIEEWYALTGEEKFLRAWKAWSEQCFFGYEARRATEASHKASEAAGFQVMRSIGVRDFTPRDLAAEWCALGRYMTRVLRGLPAHDWISWPDLRKLLFEFHPECAWTTYGQDHWWFGPPFKATRLDPARFEDWKRTSEAILEVILAESLRWLGIVETSVDGAGLQAFRLTETHTWLSQTPLDIDMDAPAPPLPASAAPRPRQAEPVTWLTDRQWRLPAAPDRADFIAFARKIAEPGAAPFTYNLTPASIEHALAQGIGLDEVRRQFESFNAPLPLPAQTLYTSIAEHFGRVRVYEALTVLHLGDDYALRELLANTSLAQHVVYQISPRAVVIHPEAVETLAQEMVARGYTPGVK